MAGFDTSQHGHARLKSGMAGAKRLEAGTLEEEIFSVKALTDVTFGAGCTVARGDAPESGDALARGDILMLPFTKVVISSGTVFCYTL